ncbi:MAG TPA: histidine phosphatase family protein [Blastocatellia bacterium]|nr:histidine phosphatase family protein [Blastocatellia bacterium]
MSQLILVRHGQAAFLTDDYDRLSPLGEEQSRLLGNYWIQRNVAFDAVFTGPRKRQRDTGRIVCEQYKQADLPIPELIELPEFDEYDADGIMTGLLPQLLERDERFRQLHEAFAQSANDAERRRNFQKRFEVITLAWVRGELLSPDVESFREFHSRVQRGLQHIQRTSASGSRVAVFSSGGAISVTTQIATRAHEEMVLEFNWRVRNCALNEFVFSKDRLSLDSFNAIPHLDDPKLQTYR